MQLGQVVTNLVGNAVHAMEKSGIIEVQGKNVDLTNVSPSHRPTGLDSRPLPGTHYIELRFKDQGPGIPDSIRDKIFDPFFTTREKGTGLGLSVVFSVVQNHGGAIELLSPPGEGATFILFLPAIGTSSGPAPTAEDAPLTGHKRVLLMDDDPAVREVCQGLLASLGYDVVSTVEGGEAVEEYRRSRASDRPFDFCILDLIVPEGMPGTECAKQILAFDPNAVLLVSSGYSDDPVLSHYQEYGFKGIIPKPYTIEELRAAIGKKLVN
jgi:CheY-like chemotaxis protein